MNRTVVVVLALVLVVLGGVVGWKAAWRYDDARLDAFGPPKKIRTHLVTGEVEMLGAYGWRPHRPVDLPLPSPASSISPSVAPRYQDLVAR